MYWLEVLNERIQSGEYMKVSRVEAPVDPVAASKADVLKALESLATRHNTTVEELVKGAKAAGYGGAEYQIRTLNLVRRLEKLEN